MLHLWQMRRKTSGHHLAIALFALAACKGSVASRPAAPPAVTIARSGAARARVIVLTGAVAIKETGPAATVRAFGEVYDFIPQTIIVRRDEPTQIVFWNLQADDEHDLMLTDPRNRVLLTTKLPALRKTNFVMTFHETGLFPFYCTVHQPAMSGQILVIAQ
jgi:plastocyanin